MLNKSFVAGCFYLDSCVVFSEILKQHAARMGKFKRDVDTYKITCYVSESVVKECEEKIEKTINFIEKTLNDVITFYLKGEQPRELDMTRVSNDDLHRVQECFFVVNPTARNFDLITDPFQAMEEFIVEKLEKELEKPEDKRITLDKFILYITTIILQVATKLKSSFESLVELESDYISKSNQQPDPLISQILVQKGIHQSDADHISAVASHQKKFSEKAVFLTFDYKTILLKWRKIKHISNIVCCDPIYGLSYLR